MTPPRSTDADDPGTLVRLVAQRVEGIAIKLDGEVARLQSWLGKVDDRGQEHARALAGIAGAGSGTSSAWGNAGRVVALVCSLAALAVAIVGLLRP